MPVQVAVGVSAAQHPHSLLPETVDVMSKAVPVAVLVVPDPACKDICEGPYDWRLKVQLAKLRVLHGL